jgi:tetratricopeptide (TPR) repeat protein
MGAVLSWCRSCRGQPQAWDAVDYSVLRAVARLKAIHVDDARGVGARLRAAREQSGLSQRALAFPGCSAAYLSRIEAGERTPSLQVLRELARRLGVREEYLATGAARGRSSAEKLVEAEVALRLDETELAERLFAEVLEGSEPGVEQGRALAGLGQLAFRQGDPARAIERFERALELAGEGPPEPALADTLGRSYALMGRLEDAVALFKRVLAAAEAVDDAIGRLRFTVLLANALIDQAEFAEAEALLAPTLEQAERSRDPLLRARLYWSQSRLHAEQDEPEQAASYARKALEILELTEHATYVARARQLLAHIELDRGEASEALTLLAEGRELMLGASELEQAQYRLEEARALAALGEREQAIKLALEVSGVMARAAPEDAGRGFALLADLFASLGEAERAGELYELAVELLERNPNRYLVHAYTRYADFLQEQGRQDEAFRLLRKALSH